MIARIEHSGGAARVVYLGSPAMAVAPLQALVAAGHDVALVVTNPDRRRGRGKDLMPTPVKAAAVELGLPVSHDIDDVPGVEADFGVVVAYGRIVTLAMLQQLPMVNLHFSLLPRWRGAAPLERAILAGDEKTGVCLMEIVEALDEGAVYARREVPIGDASLAELRELLVRTSCDLLIDSLAHGFDEPVEQVGEPVYAHKLHTADFSLDFTQPAAQLSRVVRLGRAFTTLDGRRFGVLEATAIEGGADARPGHLDGVTVATADGRLVLERVQPEGKKPMDATAWRNGARLPPDVCLGE